MAIIYRCDKCNQIYSQNSLAVINIKIYTIWPDKIFHTCQDCMKIINDFLELNNE